VVQVTLLEKKWRFDLAYFSRFLAGKCVPAIQEGLKMKLKLDTADNQNCSTTGKQPESAIRRTNPAAIAVSVGEAAQRAGVGRGYLYEQISKGQLRARKAGRRTLIALADLAAWVEALPTFAKSDLSDPRPTSTADVTGTLTTPNGNGFAS
jgi:excisionase family DNA binding protein